MYKLPDVPLSVGQVLDHGLRIFRACFSRVFPLALVGALAAAAFGLILDAPEGELPDFTVGLAIAWLLTTVVGVFVAVAIIARIDLIAKDDEAPLGAALGVAAARSIPFFVAGVLYGIATFLGLVLLLVPGFILMVSLSMVFYAVVLDGMGPVEGLRYSHRLVWGDWWRTAGVLTVVVAIVVVAYVVIAAAGGVAVSVFGMPGVPAITRFARLIVVPALNSVFTPLTYAFGLVIYNDLKLRREGGDIAARIQAAEGH